MSRPDPRSPGFVPVRLDDVDLQEPLPRLPATGADNGTIFARSMCLVRLHGKPLGIIELDLPPDGLPPERLAARINEKLRAEIGRHLAADRMAIADVGVEGFGQDDSPVCQS